MCTLRLARKPTPGTRVLCDTCLHDGCVGQFGMSTRSLYHVKMDRAASGKTPARTVSDNQRPANAYYSNRVWRGVDGVEDAASLYVGRI